MDVVIIFNGLGNQMSQYAFFLSKRKNDKKLRLLNIGKSHNGFELGKVFKISYQHPPFKNILVALYRVLCFKKLRAVFKPFQLFLNNSMNIRVINENYDYNFKREYLLPSAGNVTFYLGGWHSEKYFKSIREEIIEAFTFTPPDDFDNVELINNIQQSNSVSIHVRRGDYLSAENLLIFGNVCGKGYFERATALIMDKVSEPLFFVFSNDIPWVKQNLILKNVVYVTCNSGQNSWKDMYLMSLCKHNIIANSSFSWWGAWLNKNPGKIVLCPNRFLKNDIYTDVYPDEWIRIEDY